MGLSALRPRPAQQAAVGVASSRNVCYLVRCRGAWQARSVASRHPRGTAAVEAHGQGSTCRAIIGYGDSRLARLSSIALTTIAQDTDQLTALPVDRAVDRLAGTASEHRAQVLPPRLIQRSTTGPSA
jgi:hypothetical protein